jgi:DNA polymerase III delta prime subunit
MAISQLKNYASSKVFPNLILYGPTGTGKSAAARVFAEQILEDTFHSNYKNLNIRDIRNYPITKAKRNIKKIAKLSRDERSELDEYMSIVFREAKAARKLRGESGNPNRSQLLHEAISLFASTITVSDELVKILVLDEADALDNNMQQALRRTMEIYSDATRFIFITPSLSGWNPAIVSRCLVVKFRAGSIEILRSLVEDIAGKENVEIDGSGLDAIAREADGDFRRAINLLQVSASTGRSVDEDTVYEYSDTLLNSEVREIVSLSLAGRFLKARKKLRFLLALEGYSPKNVILAIQAEILNRPFENAIMSKALKRIAEIDFRMTQARNSFIQLEALLASLGNLESDQTD